MKGVLKLLLFFILCSSLYSKLLLLKVYDEASFKDADLKGFLMSEKLDGLRGYWDGSKLLSKNQKELNPPKDFIKDFPPFMLDGELWFQRKSFEKTVSIVRSDDWSKLSLNVFDVPNACEYFKLSKCSLQNRLNALKNWLCKHPNKNIRIIKQIALSSKAQLKAEFEALIAAGAEGVVLRKDDAPYERKRSKNALKYKPFYDAECKVLGYQKGKGKYEGKMGAIFCEAKLKIGLKILKIGSGFSDKQRENPPKIGQIITYKYQGFTKKGLPRFPIFLRLRRDSDL